MATLCQCWIEIKHLPGRSILLHPLLLSVPWCVQAAVQSIFLTTLITRCLGILYQHGNAFSLFFSLKAEAQSSAMDSYSGIFLSSGKQTQASQQWVWPEHPEVCLTYTEKGHWWPLVQCPKDGTAEVAAAVFCYWPCTETMCSSQGGELVCSKLQRMR